MHFLHKLLLFFVFFLLFGTKKNIAQCSLYPVPFEEKIRNASLIVEGKVIHSYSFWNSSKTMIFTAHELEIYKVFKGVTDSIINIVTVGGQVDEVYIEASSLIKLRNGEFGIFSLNESAYQDITFPEKSYEVYASKQGFVKYNLFENAASDVFNSYPSIDELYYKIEFITMTKLVEIKSFTRSVSNILSNRSVPIITNFSPLTIVAGNKSQLTINGSGFGNNPKVKFRNANYKEIHYTESLSTQIVSKSDNKIVVEVPDFAGNGRIVVSDGIDSVISVINLDILFSYSNIESNGYAYPSRLINKNAGGYIWQMYAEFDDNKDAKSAFLRAFTNWRCGSMVNWSLGEVTEVDKTERDNINVIRFDRGNELPAGILGICYSYYSSCGTGKWYVSENDIVLDDDTKWNYSLSNPLSSQYDCETIVLHELGHGHQLGHVIDNNDLMHNSVGAGKQKRTLSEGNLNCAKMVLDNSTISSICSQTPMMTLTNEVCEDVFFGFFDFEGIDINPNPFRSNTRISYQIASQTQVDIEIFDMLGNKVFLLISEIQNPGRYIYNLNPTSNELNSGLYVIRINLNGVIHSSKMLKVNF